MNDINQKSSVYNFEKIVDIIVRIGLLFVIFSWCFDILRPFVLILIWATVITVAVYPLFTSVTKILGGNKIIASILLTLILLSIIIIPSLLVMHSLFEGITHLREVYNSGQPIIPPPGANTQSWPVIAKPILDFWQFASTNLQETMMKYAEQLKTGGKWMLTSLAGISVSILQFIGSVIIAGVFLIYSDSISIASKKIFEKLAGKSGDEFADITVGTIRNVVKGILGVAIIQAAMAGTAFFVAGVPFAGLWTVLCLILAIVQIGVGPIAIPIVVYMFSVMDSFHATILAVWIVITLISDNVLKPILLGRGAPAPMLVIFLGAIGGFIYNGFIGLFLGAVILTIGYKLLIAWLNNDIESENSN